VARALGWLRQPGPARADGTPSPREPAPAPQPISEKSIAVLPFRNLAQDSSLDPLRLALADGLASALAGLTGLAVRPLDLVVRHLDSEVEVPRLAQELSVGFLLTGSFLVSGGRLRLRVQLLGSGGSDLVWADRVDAPRDDVLAAQDAITEVGVAAVRQHLELAATAAPPGRNAEAHGFYLRGREMPMPRWPAATCCTPRATAGPSTCGWPSARCAGPWTWTLRSCGPASRRPTSACSTGTGTVRSAVAPRWRESCPAIPG
jgi:TolB-like protein